MTCLFFASAVAGADCQAIGDLNGMWENELGSLLVVDSTDVQGRIFGHYRSSTGVDGRVFPLQGWVNRSTGGNGVTSIAFAVRWEGYGSITSWTGYRDRDDDGPFIKTLWHLVRPGTEYSWERIITNSSVFRPVRDEGKVNKEK